MGQMLLILAALLPKLSPLSSECSGEKILNWKVEYLSRFLEFVAKFVDTLLQNFGRESCRAAPDPFLLDGGGEQSLWALFSPSGPQRVAFKFPLRKETHERPHHDPLTAVTMESSTAHIHTAAPGPVAGSWDSR